jgi:hypothetical protein
MTCDNRQPHWTPSTGCAVELLVASSSDRLRAERAVRQLFFRFDRLPTLALWMDERQPKTVVAGVIVSTQLLWDERIGVRLVFNFDPGATLTSDGTRIPLGGLETILGHRPTIKPLTVTMTPAYRVRAEVYEFAGHEGVGRLSLHGWVIAEVVKTKGFRSLRQAVVRYMVEVVVPRYPTLVPPALRRPLTTRPKSWTM